MRETLALYSLMASWIDEIYGEVVSSILRATMKSFWIASGVAYDTNLGVKRRHVVASVANILHFIMSSLTRVRLFSEDMEGMQPYS